MYIVFEGAWVLIQRLALTQINTVVNQLGFLSKYSFNHAGINSGH